MRSHVAQRSGILALSVLIALISTSNHAARGQTDNQIEPVRPSIGMRQVANEAGVLFAEPMPGYAPGECKFGVECFKGLLHAGTDYSANPGTDVLAIAPGYVSLTSDNGKPECCTIKDGRCTPQGGCDDHGLGRVVILSHVLADGETTIDGKTTVYSLYAHLSEISTEIAQAKEAGRCVPQGFRIGTVGASGYGLENYWTEVVKNTRPHLHLEIKQSPTLSNPLKSPSYYGYIPKSAADINLTNWGYYPPETFIGQVRAKPCPSSHQPIPVPIALPPLPGSTVIDDSSAAFAKQGTPSFWESGSGGADGSFVWTRNNTAGVDNIGTWTISVTQSGLYEVFVFIPSDHASTTNAVYEIRHAGKTDYVAVDQSQYTNQWHSLGIFDFEGKGVEYVRLTDVTGEPDNTKEIAFDAIGIIRREQSFLERLWSDIQRIGRDIGDRIGQIKEWLDKLKNPQALLEQLIEDAVDQMVRALLIELQRFLQGLCGSIAFAALSVIVIARRRHTRK